MQHDFCRDNVINRLKAAIDKDGMPMVWVNNYTANEGSGDRAHIFYDVPYQAYCAVKNAASVPIVAWHSPVASVHCFFAESLIDELAYQASQNPLEFRGLLLKDKHRHLTALKLAAEKAGWGSPFRLAARGGSQCWNPLALSWRTSQRSR